MRKTKSLKAIVLSLGLAALMAPATMNAQNGGGLFSRGETSSDHAIGSSNESMMRQGDPTSINGGFSNQGYGEPAPLGSGIAVLLLAGVGYVALKKKED